MADIVFVQPHFDDVALSCGGTVAACAMEGSPVIVTMFGGEPTGTAADFARFQHERWNLDDSDVVRVRRDEDRAAASVLGASVSVVWLDYLDAIYRRPAYSSEEALFGDLVDEDLALVEEIGNELSRLGERFVFPMAVGGHVDHKLAFEVGRALGRAGRQVSVFADMPYALDCGAYDGRLAELGDPPSSVRHVSPPCFEKRWKAIGCYGSQLPVIFRNIDDPKKKLAAFGRRPGDDSPVELFWKLDDVDGQAR